jgi:CDP-4-dehydro-6-deoxyglucose reductase
MTWARSQWVSGSVACKRQFDILTLNIAKQSDLYIAAPAEVLIYLGELLLENGVDESQLIASPI